MRPSWNLIEMAGVDRRARAVDFTAGDLGSQASFHISPGHDGRSQDLCWNPRRFQSARMNQRMPARLHGTPAANGWIRTSESSPERKSARRDIHKQPRNHHGRAQGASPRKSAHFTTKRLRCDIPPLPPEYDPYRIHRPPRIRHGLIFALHALHFFTTGFLHTSRILPNSNLHRLEPEMRPIMDTLSKTGGLHGPLQRTSITLFTSTRNHSRYRPAPPEPTCNSRNTPWKS